jgi:hypothetical protein
MFRPCAHAWRILPASILLLVAIATCSATTAIALRSRHHVVLATDSRAIYGAGAKTTECKLFAYGNVYATVAGFAHYGSSYRATDAIRDGFARPGTFPARVSATASYLQQRVQAFLSAVQRSDPNEYRRLLQRTNAQADFVELAIAENVHGQPMLGIIELQREGENSFRAKTTICPGNCRQGEGLFYLGYWESIKPYVANSGQTRSIGSAASIDRLIRLEMKAHPAEVAAPINIVEVNASGARWLQSGGNCSLPGVSW